MFEGRKLIIVTKHQKEKVIAPILEKELGVECFVTDTFDTDSFGTFTGEVSRKDTALETLRQKCLLGMAENNYDLGVASEGSFGPHPTIFFANADDELLILIDTKNNLEIVARELSTDTNFNGTQIESENDLIAFATKVKFPSHALILKPNENDYSKTYKGITDFNDLNIKYKALQNEYGTAYVETDMRAMYNPTRMSVIEQATHKLIQSIKNCCPKCATPGFKVAEVKSGLRCELCNLPTRSTLSYIYQCQRCLFEKEVLYPFQKEKEDPMYCDFCNP
jgi:hypothetical protein